MSQIPRGLRIARCKKLVAEYLVHLALPKFVTFIYIWYLDPLACFLCELVGVVGPVKALFPPKKSSEIIFGAMLI